MRAINSALCSDRSYYLLSFPEILDDEGNFVRKADMPYMSQLTGKTEKELFGDLKGVVFLNPMHAVDEDGRPKYCKQAGDESFRQSSG